ncbi:putative Xre family DNA-binding protein [Oscillibacter valericigenes Sjm18-20]|nr:putative Xre family DNA-binding protein [Oscillibacter valericigenes Sjm18-20]
MNHYVTGSTVRELREKKKLTQKQLAETLCVSDKTVSKWETGRGLPDISLLEPLASELGISVAELLSGECFINANRSANLLRSKFYVCPICGNVIWAAGEGAYSCCGVSLPPLEAEEPDKAHEIRAERVENEWYTTVDHTMSKSHFISFLAFVTDNRVQIARLYPEQSAEARFSMCGQGRLYAYCNRHGLFSLRV